jgi:hypothetical protein
MSIVSALSWRVKALGIAYRQEATGNEFKLAGIRTEGSDLLRKSA